MGVSLRYAKVIDREELQRRGGVVRPGLDSRVRLTKPAPAAAAPFFILRAWDHVNGAFTETWRILDPHGRTVHEPMSREVLPGQREIADEIEELMVEYADSGYQLVLEVDGREVARADFPVDEDLDDSAHA
jgi:hypothetical protein